MPRVRYFVLPRASAMCAVVALTTGIGVTAMPAFAADPPQKSAAATRAAPARAVASGPAWSELSRSQQTALKPLASVWGSISEAQKRKWIALSANYASLQPEEQARLHGRMTDWVSLNPQQRAQARLNFGESRKIPAQEKKAKWEAYQALSPEEKDKLASRASRKAAGAAVAVKPVSPQKLATVPAPRPDSRHSAKITSGRESAAEAGQPVAGQAVPASSQ
ncbi:DUF3106 domain-containing protein [Variovorax sp. VNK109]|uniref:DUF3106 domain-containing protein n=1 Tax=Variovorax sp. VNK109 TaxID=3400919 RepID=UPI003C076F06